jgi:hypothetical protein
MNSVDYALAHLTGAPISSVGYHFAVKCLSRHKFVQSDKVRLTPFAEHHSVAHASISFSPIDIAYGGSFI